VRMWGVRLTDIDVSSKNLLNLLAQGAQLNAHFWPD